MAAVREIADDGFHEFDDLCRLCATKTNLVHGVHMFEDEGIIRQILKKIELCLPIQIHENDHLPKIVCENCLYKLDLLYDFRDRTIRTSGLLSDLFKALTGHDVSNVKLAPLSTHTSTNTHFIQNRTDIDIIPSQQQHDIHSLSDSRNHHNNILVDNNDSHDIPSDIQSILRHSNENDLILRSQNDNHELVLRQTDNNELVLRQTDSNELVLRQTDDNELVLRQTDSNELVLRQTDNNELLLRNHELILRNGDSQVIQRLVDVNVAQYNAHNDNLQLMNDNGPIMSENGQILTNGRIISDYSLESLRLDESSIQQDSNSSDVKILTHQELEPDVSGGDRPMIIQGDQGNLNDIYMLSTQNSHSPIDERLQQCTGVIDQEKTSDATSSNNVHFNYEDSEKIIKCTLCLGIFKEVEMFDKHYLEEHTKEIKQETTNSSSNEETLTDKLLETSPKITDVSKEKLEENSATKQEDFDYDEDEDDLLDEEDLDDDDYNVGEKDSKEETVVSSKRTKGPPKVCEQCGKMYRTNYKLQEHMRKHTGETPFKCGTCDKAFRSKIGLAQHEAKHTGQYEFSCTVCGKGFQCRSYLVVHQRVHSDLKPFPCNTCSATFKTKQGLQDHTNRHLGVKPFMCDVCGRGFITKGLCKTHQKIHTGVDIKKYSCKVCNKMFVSKSYMQTHLRIHTGEKPFMCEVCGKGFLTRVDLRIHSTMHTGEKSFVCEMCGKAFARRDALSCHRRSHTGERPYSCDQCGQSFTQFSPMVIHKRLHTGERPYECDVCKRKFVSRSTMMAHAKKHVR